MLDTTPARWKRTRGRGNGYQRPKVPTFTAGIDSSVRQLHRASIGNPSQLAGDVWSSAPGTSGVEIAIGGGTRGSPPPFGGTRDRLHPPIFYVFKGRVFWFHANRIASVGLQSGAA